MTYTIQIRPKRQATLPAPLLQKLGVETGDSLQIEVQGKKAVITPKKQLALDAFKELQKLVKESGISEKEMLESAEKIRTELNEKRSS